MRTPPERTGWLANGDSLDMHHEVIRNLLDGALYRAPVQNPRHILDVGTGTGIWAIDVADKHPAAAVLGTDLSPIQPHWLPANCTFEIADAAAPWAFAQQFDLVHVRNLGNSLSDYPALAAAAFNSMHVDGYIELSEGGGACPAPIRLAIPR